MVGHSQKKSEQTENRGSFSVVGTGVIAVLALAVLGGGVFAFNMMRNQNNPSINVEGAQANANNEGVNIALEGSKIGSDADTGSASVASVDADGNTFAIDVNAEDALWRLKFPLYKVKDEQCTLAGNSSVMVNQLKGGTLAFDGNLNVYGGSYIRGTISPRGKADASIASKNGKSLITLEGELAGGADETLITGTATMVGCPESTFELSR